MQLGGLQGSVGYRGNLASFLPLFALAESLHIGKQASFGLDQIRLEWTPGEKDSRSPVQ